MADYFIEKHNYSKPGNTFSVVAESVGDKPTEDGEYPTARMAAWVYPAQESPNFDFTKKELPHLNEHQLAVSKETGLDPKTLSGDLHIKFKDAVQEKGFIEDYYGRYAAIRYAKAISGLRKGSTELFTTTPPSVHIDEAFSHSKMRHTIPTMGAYLNQKFGNIEVSSDLSAHSAPLVRNLQKKGYNVKVANDEEPEMSNDVDFDDESNTVTSDSRYEMLNSPTRLSKQEVASAKEHFRSIRRGDRPEPKSLGPQFEQLKFPGM